MSANHGGEAIVWSEPGRGSTFTMRLPAAAVGRRAAVDNRTPADADEVVEPERAEPWAGRHTPASPPRSTPSARAEAP